MADANWVHIQAPVDIFTGMIQKAVIPIAGAGSRMAPLSAAIPKALFPLVDRAGRCRPVLHWIAAQAAWAGIEELALVVDPHHEPLVRSYLEAARSAEPPLPPDIRLVRQPHRGGLGDAVARCAEFAADEPFMLFLGDHVYVNPPASPPCALQVAQAFDTWGGSAMVGMQPVPQRELSLVGVAKGEPLAPNVYRCRDLMEKPDPQTAGQRLTSPGLEQGMFLAHCGIYAFTPEIFDCLAQAARDCQKGEELQLTSAQQILLKRRPDDCYLLTLTGKAMDVGTPQGYAQTCRAMANWQAD